MCNLCNDLGYVRSATQGRLDRCACKAVEDAARLQNRIGSSCPSVRFADLQTGNRPGTTRMVKAAAEWVKSPCGFLTIWGANGTGKSMALQAITTAAIATGTAAVYVRAHDAVEFLKRGIGDDDYDVIARLTVLASVPVLCIDELTLVRWTDWVAEQLESLLDQRYASDRGTALAMDEDPASRLHPRLLSRMLEGVVIENHDTDFRVVLGQAKRG